MLKRKKGKDGEILTVMKPDRRLLSKVPDPEQIRVSGDRRRVKNYEELDKVVRDTKDIHDFNERFMANFSVNIESNNKERKQIKAQSIDVSVNGILVRISNVEEEEFTIGDTCKLEFEIPPGTMMEGFESKFEVEGTVARTFKQVDQESIQFMVAFQFTQPLYSVLKKQRWTYSVSAASLLLTISVIVILLMRIESIIYLKYNFVLYLYSIIAAVFLLSRYLFGAFYKDVPINPNFTPSVSIIIPCFNEEKWIKRTILSCINQDYPVEKLEVIVVDDRSTDGSVEEINKIVTKLHSEVERYKVSERLKLILSSENGGKREALVQGVKAAKNELVVFVDSDSFLEHTAIKHIVQPFQDPKMGGVAGRTDVENKYTNFLTKLQTVRYYVAFRIMKAAESIFDCVTCLSGPLSCYRKDLVLAHSEAWLNQKFLGQPATFGDDRSMTNFILKTHRTGYQDSAICSTIVPSAMNIFLKQQMRWKRSWLRESLMAGSFIWKKEPFMSLFFYVGLLVPIAAPIIVMHNLIYVPIVYKIFPSTFLLGLLLMALLMSFTHLLFRKSKLWIFGMVFCLFYELVLLWQMPVAWVTFWKSTWGTRDTPQDVEARDKKNSRRMKQNTGLKPPI